MSYVLPCGSLFRFRLYVLGTAALLLACASAAAQVLPGIDVLVRGGFDGLEGKRIGLVINQTSLRRDVRRSTLDAFLASRSCRVVALFAPEHGIDASSGAGEQVGEMTDLRTGLPIHSLYGATKRPTAVMLRDVDVMVYDIQDIGVRSYTYISTMIKVMEGCAAARVPLVVLDRPNPIGGDVIDGPVLDTAFRSFVGIVPVPYVYGLTAGELAMMANGEGWLADRLHCNLRVVRMRGWHRSMEWRETGMTWIPTSPHIPTPEAAFAYAVTGAIGEISVANIGVGYTLPFQLLGAPWIAADSFALYLNGLKLPGLYFRPTAYKPFYAMYTGVQCGGVQVMRTGESTAPFTTTIALLAALRDRAPGGALFGAVTDERWRMFDKVCGGDRIRLQLLAGADYESIVSEWRPALRNYIARREEYLIYE